VDSDTHSAQVARLEVVDSGRRRRRSDEEKLKIVLESLAAPRQVSAQGASSPVMTLSWPFSA
jgi:transposase